MGSSSKKGMVRSRVNLSETTSEVESLATRGHGSGDEERQGWREKQ